MLECDFETHQSNLFLMKFPIDFPDVALCLPFFAEILECAGNPCMEWSHLSRPDWHV